jgi:cytochrome P450
VTLETVERALAGIVLGVVVWPVVRACASGEFRRAFPVLTAALAALLAACVMGLALVLVLAPRWAVGVLAVVGLAVLAALRWHAAVARGAARGLPPGSLAPLQLGPWFDRGFYLDRHRELGTPFKTVQFVRPMACFVGLAEGLDFLKANEASLGSPGMPFGRFIRGGFLRHMPPELHTVTKGLFAAAFTREVYAPLAPFMRDTFRAELTRMARTGDGVPPRRHVQRAIFSIWMRLFFDVAPDAPARERLKTLYRTLDIRNPTHASDRAIRAAVDEITAIARERRRAARDDGAPRSFLAALERARPGAVDDPTLLGNLVYLGHTSWADVSGLLVWAFRMLTDHAAWADRLRAVASGAREDDGDPPLATRIVMETLRLEQSEHLYRVANRDLARGGTTIPRGWLVRLCVRESHQDPRVFADPATFDPDRFRDRAYSLREYSPFGGGLRHACVGEGLTTHVASIFAETLAAGFRWSTVADGPYEYSAWRHWRPGSAWRVKVAELA